MFGLISNEAGLFLFQKMCMGSALSSNPASMACGATGLSRTSFKSESSSEDFKLT